VPLELLILLTEWRLTCYRSDAISRKGGETAMAKFIKLQPTNEKEMFVNVEHIIFVQPFDGGVTNISMIESRGFKIKGSYEDIIQLISG
jgi:hypothetical protein